jgi:SAM-dependent methyltransferase
MFETKHTTFGYFQEGWSPAYTKRMALEAKLAAVGQRRIPIAADIGAGSGEFSRTLTQCSGSVLMLDFYRPVGEPPERTTFVQTDLNASWPLPDDSVDFGFALEVIEHVENPRHFMRQFARILKPGGFGFLTTPNNHSWASKLTFLLKGEHRRFQGPSYPAHLTPLLQCDLERILAEVRLLRLCWSYSNCDTLPRLHWNIRLPGKAFSDSMGILFQKPNPGS